MNTATNTLQTWLVVADGEHAVVYVRTRAERFVPQRSKQDATHSHYTNQSEWKLDIVRELNADPEALFDTQGDRGEVFDSHGYGRHGTAPKESLQEHRSRGLIENLAEMLNEAFAQSEFLRLVLTAPPKLLGELREGLDANVRQAVVAELPKNLSHESTSRLVDLLGEALAPASS